MLLVLSLQVHSLKHTIVIFPSLRVIFGYFRSKCAVLLNGHLLYLLLPYYFLNSLFIQLCKPILCDAI
jgi:hypothetical protein